MRIVAAMTVIVLICAGMAGAQDLPDDILADQYLWEAIRAFDIGDIHSALAALEKIEALNINPPLDYLFLKGRILVEYSVNPDELLEGQSLLEQFVQDVDRESESYAVALELLSLAKVTLESIGEEQQELAEQQAAVTQYMQEAMQAVEKNDLATARQAFDKIEALDIEPPLHFLFLKGKVLVEHGPKSDELLAGQSLLKQFVLSVDRDSEFYSQALGLLSLAEAKLERIEAEQQAKAERERKEARVQAERLRTEAAQLRAEAERLRQAKLKELLLNELVPVKGGSFTMGCEKGHPAIATD